MLPGMKFRYDLDDEDESFDATLNLNDATLNLKVNGAPNEPATIEMEQKSSLRPANTEIEIKSQIKTAQKQIRDYEEEQRRKERELEREIERRLKNVERAEKLVNEGKDPRKSSCCEVI